MIRTQRYQQIIVITLMSATSAIAQRCDSISASYVGGWKPAATAPRDGTTVEMLETFGIAPWYGLFKWTKAVRTVDLGDGQTYTFTEEKPAWNDVENPRQSVSEDSCLFWRPRKSGGKYVDPTGGAQKTIAYWCAAMHRPYDPKADRCK